MAHVLVAVHLCREHDKGPDELSSVITKLLDTGAEFKLSILGAHTNDIPGEGTQMISIKLSYFSSLVVVVYCLSLSFSARSKCYCNRQSSRIQAKNLIVFLCRANYMY